MISTVAIITIIVCPENIFRVSSPLVELRCGTINATKSSIRMLLGFLVLLISFETKDAVYINKVIIPEANVRMVIKETHLVIVDLNIIVVERMDKIKIKIAIVTGFVFFLA